MRHYKKQRRLNMSVYDMPRLANFSAVAKHYNSIDPVISKRHTRENDVRPLGDRRRKYERIHKFSDDCYAYYDGDMGDPIQYSDHHYMAKDIPMDACKALAPIMWTLEEINQRWNKEILRVRNGSGNGAHNGRYSFLERALPREFNFVVDNGKGYAGRCTQRQNTIRHELQFFEQIKTMNNNHQ